MKFRAIPRTDLLLSEVGLALDAPGFPHDALAAELLLRIAYDEGINLFLFAGPPHPFDSAFRAAFEGERRSKIHLAIRLSWSGDAAALSQTLEARLRSLGSREADVLVIEGLNREDLQDGAVGALVHRLRASGRIDHAAFRGGSLNPSEDAGLIERSGFFLSEDDVDLRLDAIDERRPPLLAAVPPIAQYDSLSYLWQDTGRTPRQAAIQLALSHPDVGSVLVRPESAVELKELARAPLAAPLSVDEIAAARSALAEPVGA